MRREFLFTVLFSNFFFFSSFPLSLPPNSHFVFIPTRFYCIRCNHVASTRLRGRQQCPIGIFIYLFVRSSFYRFQFFFLNFVEKIRKKNSLKWELLLKYEQGQTAESVRTVEWRMNPFSPGLRSPSIASSSPSTFFSVLFLLF